MEVRGPTKRTRRKSDEKGKTGVECGEYPGCIERGWKRESSRKREKREIQEKERGIEGSLENKVADEKAIERKRKEKGEQKK